MAHRDPASFPSAIRSPQSAIAPPVMTSRLSELFTERFGAPPAAVEEMRALLAPTLEAYQKRNFTHLSVAFGCTGGQHRSVYCAEQLAKSLRARGVAAEVTHRDMPTFGA